MPVTPPSRPALRYHGGKWLLSPWIISHFPAHRIYVEPYGGAASVLLRKPRVYSEVYNDLDGEIVNLFQVLRDDGPVLARKLSHTPFARAEYRLSFELADDPLEQARRTVVRSFMGFGSNSLCRLAKSGFRASANRQGTTPAHDWRNFAGALKTITARLRGVVIEHRLAEEVMAQQDREDTLHYCDPPYVHSTRTNWAGSGSRSGYRFEMSDDDHRAMARCLHALRGKVVVSGYASELYDRELFADWRRVERPALADGARPRKEILWLNF